MATLTGRQRAIVVAMVEAHREKKSQFSWYATFSGSQIQGCGISLPAARDDVVTLQQAGYISAHEVTNSINITLRQEAYHAVRSLFGMSRDRLVLEAIYSASNAKSQVQVLRTTVAAMTGLTEAEVDEVESLLQLDGLILKTDDGSMLSPRGLIAAESAPAKPAVAAPPTTVSTQYNFSNGGSVIVQNGSGNTASAVQNYGAAAAELLPLVEAIRAAIGELSADKRTDAAEHIADLEAEIKSGRGKRSIVKGSIAALASMAIGTATFAKNVAQISSALEHTEANVIKMVDDARGNIE